MKFRAHDTFFIRKGWIYKGLKNVNISSDAFISTDTKPTDTLGIGSNMVKALRFWLQAVGLTTEPKSGKRLQTFTDLGHIIFENDKYIEEIGTLWLIHYKLATNKDLATTWYYFFNEFNRSEFTQDDFVNQIAGFLTLNNQDISDRSIEDDFKCIIHTYLSKKNTDENKSCPENNIDCPLRELGLIDIVNKKERIYKKMIPKVDAIPPLIALAVIVDQSKGKKDINISTIQNDDNNLGKIFNLDTITLISILNKLEILNYIKVVRTAGLDVIKIEKDLTFIDCISIYYENINS